MTHGFISGQNGKDTMLALRNDGLTNQQIAQHMHCSYNTVKNTIGRQPDWIDGRKNKKEYAPAVPRKETIGKLIEEKQTAQENDNKDMLVDCTFVKVLGVDYCYLVDFSKKNLEIVEDKNNENKIKIKFDQLKELINELMIVNRKTENANPMQMMDLWN